MANQTLQEKVQATGKEIQQDWNQQQGNASPPAITQVEADALKQAIEEKVTPKTAPQPQTLK